MAPATPGVFNGSVRALSRAARLLAGVVVVLIVLLLALSTPWAKAVVFDRATAWARSQFGVHIRAATFDYSILPLHVFAEGLSVAGAASPDQPMARVGRLDVDLAASALRGRLDFDSIRLRDARFVFDATTRRSGPASRPAAGRPEMQLPPFSIDRLQVENLDLSVGDEDVRLDVRRLAADLRGFRRMGELGGTISAKGGIEVSFETDAIRIVLNSAEARVELEDRSRVRSWLSGTSPVAEVRATGSVPLSLDGLLDAQYDGNLRLEEFSRWWSASPKWTGTAAIAGRVSGPLRSPVASFRVNGRDLAWSALPPATLDSGGHVSSSGLVVESFDLATPEGSMAGHGTLAFRESERSAFEARWDRVAAPLIARLFSRTLAARSPIALSGTATLGWNGVTPRPGSVDGRVSATATAEPEASARGALTAEGRDGRWHIAYRQSLAGQAAALASAEVAIDEADIAASVADGRIALGAADVSDAIAQLQRLGLPLPASARRIRSERLAFEGAIDGTLSAPRVSGSLEASGVRGGGLEGLQLVGTVSADTKALRITALDVTSVANRASVQGTVPWSTADGSGSFTAHLEDLARLAPALPDAWKPRGVVDVSGDWAGGGRDLRASARVSAAAIAVNGIAFDTLSANTTLASGRITIDGLRAAQPEGTLDGSGSWSPADDTISAALSGTNLTLSLLSPASDGALETQAALSGASFQARLTGAAQRPDGTITVAADAAEVAHRLLGSLTARVDATEGVTHIVADVPTYGATLEGRLRQNGSWPFEGRLSVAGADLAALGRLAGASDSVLDRVTATVDAAIEASGSGRNLAATSATLSVTKLDGTIREHPVMVTRKGQLRVEDERVRVLEPLQVTWGATSLALTQATPTVARPGVAMSVKATLAELAELLPEMLPAGLAAEGTMTAEILLGDRLREVQPSGALTLTVASLRRGERELARDATLVADADLTTIHVRDFRGIVLGGPIEAHGTAPTAWIRIDGHDAARAVAGPATFWLKSGAAAAEVVTLLREQAPEIAGALDLTIEGSAAGPSLESVQARVRNDSREITIGGFTLSAHEPTELRLDGGLLHVDRFEWHGPRSTFRVSGGVSLVDGVEGRLKLDGTGSLALLSLFLPVRVDGQATFDLELSGPPGKRGVLGTLDLQDGTMVAQSWRLAMADWSGSVVIDRDRIDVRQLGGQFNGGEATINGHFPVGADTTTPRTLAVTVRGAFFDLPRGLRSQLDATLEWSHVGGAARLSGDAILTTRAYREPVTEVARLAAALIDKSGGSVLELPAALASTALDVHLSTVGPLAMTNSVARVELLPDLQLTGTMSRPELRGQVGVADDGRIQFGGRQYRLRDSRVEFSPERGLLPRLAISGETRVADYTVFLRFTGPPNEIETALSSDPPLGERDLQTLLVTGQTERLGRGSTSDQNAVGAMSGDVLGMAGQFVGFDAVTVSTTDDLALVSSDVDPALRLTVSKRIGRRFELVLSDNLDDNELTWVIIYRPRPGFEFRVLSRDNTEFTGEFRQEILFGPGVSPPRTTSRRRASLDRVATVTVSGDPGFAPGDVLSVTSLRAGDGFDFARWLDDRDRIAGFYQQHGHFAARIVPTRRPLPGAGEPRVALDYRVTRGPRTQLSLAGYTFPTEVESRLRQAWSDSVLVDLLEGDLARVAREHLIDAGYLRATVGVEVDDSQAEVVTATIRVEPGGRSTDRRLAFSGNTALSENDLMAAVESAGLVSPWQDPAPLLELLQAAYGARGYLAMSASTEPVVFAGSVATMPIRIVEGPQARVASLTVGGTEHVSEAEAASATGLSVGALYPAGAEQPARLALERHLRNLGYRDARVDLQATVAPAEGRVDVAVTLHEGPRYVVRGVRTTGVQSTRDVTVERATRIEPGSPASPAVADETRRRLYDIGTFRSAEVTFTPAEGAATEATVSVDAVVTLQESKRFLLLYGVEATSQYQSLFDERVTSGGLAVDLRDRNFLGRGWTLGTGLRYEPSFKSARVLTTVPKLRSRRIRTNLYGDARSEERGRTENVALVDNETTLTLEQRWRPWTPVELSWGYRFNRRDLRFEATATNETLLNIRGYLASLAGAVVIDRRDSLFDAKRGWLVSTTAEWGLQPLGSDFDYLRTVVRGSHYLPVGPLTLASNVRWSDLLAFRGQPPVSALDLFFTAGGTQTVRGYQQDSLSAYTVTINGERVSLGGTKLLVFNEEVRFPLFWLFSGAGFVDAGNTFTDERGIVLGDLAVGAGFGLRIRTPLAPVRLDLGFPVRSGTGQTSIRWHFSIGQIF